jgi:hydroxymethylpyrimidine pyrophosphatase-like HAD family hydrolase
MAIGDQENDLTMLQYAGTSVAMGNAIDAVKAVARFETTSNADEGVARAIERFVLQPRVPCSAKVADQVGSTMLW